MMTTSVVSSVVFQQSMEQRTEHTAPCDPCVQFDEVLL